MRLTIYNPNLLSTWLLDIAGSRYFHDRMVPLYPSLFEREDPAVQASAARFHNKSLGWLLGYIFVQRITSRRTLLLWSHG